MRMSLSILDDDTNAVLWMVSDHVKEDEVVAQVRALAERLIELLVSDCLLEGR